VKSEGGMKASRDRFADPLHRPTELARRYHTISTWSGDASPVSTVARAGVLRGGGPCRDFICYIDADDPELAESRRRIAKLPESLRKP
jgi:hypothetical protein